MGLNSDKAATGSLDVCTSILLLASFPLLLSSIPVCGGYVIVAG
jgi:hypothetical protein